MTTKTTSQKHAQLKKLSGQARQHIYDMLRLTSEILEDHEYVDKFGGEAQLIEAIEAEEFAHFGGQPSLASMLRAYRENPKKSTWQEYRFNLRVMIDLATPERDRGDATRVNWRALAAKEKEDRERLQEALDRANDRIAIQDVTIDELQKSNIELREEASELRGQMKLLRRDSLVA